MFTVFRTLERLSASAVEVVSVLLLLAPTPSLAQAKSVQCSPVEVMSFKERIHVRCAEAPEPGIFFFAVGTRPTDDLRFAARVLGLISAAQLSSMILTIVTDMSDQSGEREIGCLARDCRLIQAVGFSTPAPLAAPGGGTSPPAAAGRTGGFLTSDGDYIQWEAEPSAVSADRVSFELCLGSGLTWEKHMNLPDGLGHSSDLVVKDQTRCAADTLRANQVNNGQLLTFYKYKGGLNLGVMTKVQEIFLSGFGTTGGNSVEIHLGPGFRRHTLRASRRASWSAHRWLRHFRRRQNLVRDYGGCRICGPRELRALSWLRTHMGEAYELAGRPWPLVGSDCQGSDPVRNLTL